MLFRGNLRPRFGVDKMCVILALTLALSVSTVLAQPAFALNGPCYGTSPTPAPHYYSYVCYQSASKWSGIYAQWASVPLNITQADATAGQFISEVIWLYQLAPSPSWLEVGDTAGGSGIQGHPNEWARMWYWTDGALGPNYEIDNFWAYSPSDSSSHSYGIQFDFPTNLWQICKDGVCPFTRGWGNPNTFTSTKAFTGMEINRGDPNTGALQPLDSSMNSGNFVASSMLLRNPDTSWVNWPSATTQVDNPCGSAPSCLQGYWGVTPPPYTNFNNGKP